MLGVNDLALELGARPGRDRAWLAPVRAMVLAAARSRGLVALDGVCNDFSDDDRLKAECEAAAAMGWETLFEKSFSGHVDLSIISPEERDQYIAEWSQPGGFVAMLNWYRASQLIVPPPGIEVPIPEWVLQAFPKVTVPTLVIWGMQDKALLPIQLEGLDSLVDDLKIVRVADAGHFVPWEKPGVVAAALRPFLAEAGDA